jgi:hypothetical protein
VYEINSWQWSVCAKVTDAMGFEHSKREIKLGLVPLHNVLVKETMPHDGIQSPTRPTLIFLSLYQVASLYHSYMSLIG